MVVKKKSLIIQLIQFFFGTLIGFCINYIVFWIKLKNEGATVFITALVQLVLNIYILNIIDAGFFNLGLFTSQTLLIKDYVVRDFENELKLNK